MLRRKLEKFMKSNKRIWCGACADDPNLFVKCVPFQIYLYHNLLSIIGNHANSSIIDIGQRSILIHLSSTLGVLDS